MKKNVEIIPIKNKTGSHVGMILSFMIFITFVVFVLVVLQPIIDTGEGRQTTLDDTETKIMNNVSANFTTASINFEGVHNPGRACVTFESILAILNIVPPYNVIIKNESGAVQDSYIYDPTFADIRVNRRIRNNVFFKLYESSKFKALTVNTSLNCEGLNSTEYEIGSVYSGNYVFESSVRELIHEYNTNYDNLKIELGLSPASEFAFTLTLSNGSILEAAKTIKAKNIYAQETPIQYVNSDANIQSGYIITKIW